MTNLGRLVVTLGAMAGLAALGPGCDGDGSASGGAAGSSTDGGGGNGGAGGDTGGTTTTGGTGGGTTTTGGGGTGGAAGDQGVQGMALVSGGTLAKSTSFKMVFTLGQSTQNQGRTKSSSYTMQGGLIGATGSLK